MIKNFRKYREYIIYATRARLRSEVSNSYLSWIWWILEPMLDMAMYIVVFGIFFRMREDYFPIFLFIGISMWNFLSKSVRGSVGLVRRNRDIITKIYIPKSVILIKDILVNLTKMLLSFTVIILMMLVYRIQADCSALFIVPVIIELLIFTYGVCCFFLHFGVYYEDLEYVVSIMLNILMYFSGIFYSIERLLPDETGRYLIICNPVAFLINLTRGALLYRKVIDFGWLLFWLIVSIIISIAGTLLIKKNENNYVKLR